MKGLGLALAAVLACATALWSLSSDEGETTSPPAPDRVRSAVPLAGHRAAPALSVDSRPSTLPEARERPEEEAAPQPEATVAQQAAVLETRFAAETADVRWASETSRTISDDIQRSVATDVRLERVDCRASLCRAELAMTSTDTGNTFVERWVSETKWPGAALFAPDPKSQRLVIYLAKSGEILAQAN